MNSLHSHDERQSEKISSFLGPDTRNKDQAIVPAFSGDIHKGENAN